MSLNSVPSAMAMSQAARGGAELPASLKLNPFVFSFFSFQNQCQEGDCLRLDDINEKGAVRGESRTSQRLEIQQDKPCNMKVVAVSSANMEIVIVMDM